MYFKQTSEAKEEVRLVLKAKAKFFRVVKKTRGENFAVAGAVFFLFVCFCLLG